MASCSRNFSRSLGGFISLFQNYRTGSHARTVYRCISLNTGKAMRQFDSSKRQNFAKRGIPLVICGVGLLDMLGLGKKEEKVDKVTMLMKRAKLAEMKDDGKGAEKLYHEALVAVQEKRHSNSMTEKDYLYAVTHIYDSMADLALRQGQLPKAEMLYKEVMKGCLQVGMATDDNAVVEVSIKLASIYAMQNKKEMAEQGFLHCISQQETKLETMEEPDKDTKALLGIVLETYSRFLIFKKDYDNAEKYLLKSFKMAEDFLVAEHPQILILRNDLATIYIMKKEYEKAEKIIKEIIEIAERTKSQSVPSFYCNLGAVYLRKGQYADASTACNTAKTIATSMKDKMSLNQANQCLKKLEEIKEKNAASL